MRNILLLILVATVPFMSVAQKRSKKGSNAKMEKMVKKTPSEFEYMVIEGVQSTISEDERMMGKNEIDAIHADPDLKMKAMIKGRYKYFIKFNTGRISPEQIELNKLERSCSHMSDALYQAAKLGWDFINASHINTDDYVTHYYYMKRKKSSEK
tara:strand:- start:470 stop:931 length:462 start_codon:yes stop_codon:yes gene_type:complete